MRPGIQLSVHTSTTCSCLDLQCTYLRHDIPLEVRALGLHVNEIPTATPVSCCMSSPDLDNSQGVSLIDQLNTAAQIGAKSHLY